MPVSPKVTQAHPFETLNDHSVEFAFGRHGCNVADLHLYQFGFPVDQELFHLREVPEHQLYIFPRNNHRDLQSMNLAGDCHLRVFISSEIRFLLC